MTKRMRRQRDQIKQDRLYNMCLRKKSYDSVIEALGWARRAMDMNPSLTLRSYYCTNCNKFHLTSS